MNGDIFCVEVWIVYYFFDIENEGMFDDIGWVMIWKGVRF